MDLRRNHTRLRRKPESMDPVSLNDRSESRACQNNPHGRGRRLSATVTARYFLGEVAFVAGEFLGERKVQKNQGGREIQRSVASFSKILSILEPGERNAMEFKILRT